LTKQAIVPGYRLEFQYNVLAFVHKLHVFCEVQATTVSDPTGFDMITRDATPGQGVSVCADTVWVAIQSRYRAADAAFGQVLIQKRVGTAYQPVGVWVTSVVPNGAGACIIAEQSTDVFRDSAFEKVLIDTFEGNGVLPTHAVTLAATPAAQHGVSEVFANTNSGVVASSAYKWAKSRGGRYIQSWQGYTCGLNKKLRRKRFVS